MIVSASVGGGHVRAAQALDATAQSLGHEVLNVDILDFTHKGYRKAYSSGYLKLADRMPTLWGYLFDVSDRKKIKRRQSAFVRAFDRIEFARFRDCVRDFAPDRMIGTHFLPAQILAPFEGEDWFNFGVDLVVTDYYAHRYWAQPSARALFVGNPEQVEDLVDRGISRDRVHVTGIPVVPEFVSPPDRDTVRHDLGLSDATPTVLVMGGGWGANGMPEIVRSIFDAHPAQVLAVAGRNRTMQSELEALEVPDSSDLRVFGFVDNVHELMAVSDLCVSKSGGLTTAECLATGLPMLVPNPIPGQEERNADYLSEIGAGMKARSLGSLRYKLKWLLSDDARRKQMAESAKAAGRPDSARAILADFP